MILHGGVPTTPPPGKAATTVAVTYHVYTRHNSLQRNIRISVTRRANVALYESLPLSSLRAETYLTNDSDVVVVVVVVDSAHSLSLSPSPSRHL